MTWRDPTGRLFDVEADGPDIRIISTPWVPPGNPNVGMIVDPAEVITADGIPRNIITINGQFPGPTLEVMEHAQVCLRSYYSHFPIKGKGILNLVVVVVVVVVRGS